MAVIKLGENKRNLSNLKLALKDVEAILFHEYIKGRTI
jgi:hypothetical protein